MTTPAADILDVIDGRPLSTKAVAQAVGLPPVVCLHWLRVLRDDGRVVSHRGRWEQSGEERIQRFAGSVAGAFSELGVTAEEAAAGIAAAFANVPRGD